MSTILDPATVADVERYVPHRRDVHTVALEAIDYLTERGRHLEAAAGRAHVGAAAASMVAKAKALHDPT